MGAGHNVFNLATRTEQVVFSVALPGAPNDCSLLQAQSAMMVPRGTYGSPGVDELNKSRVQLSTFE